MGFLLFLACVCASSSSSSFSFSSFSFSLSFSFSSPHHHHRHYTHLLTSSSSSSFLISSLPSLPLWITHSHTSGPARALGCRPGLLQPRAPWDAGPVGPVRGFARLGMPGLGVVGPVRGPVRACWRPRLGMPGLLGLLEAPRALTGWVCGVRGMPGLC